MLSHNFQLRNISPKERGQRISHFKFRLKATDVTCQLILILIPQLASANHALITIKPFSVGFPPRVTRELDPRRSPFEKRRDQHTITAPPLLTAAAPPQFPHKTPRNQTFLSTLSLCSLLTLKLQVVSLSKQKERMAGLGNKVRELKHFVNRGVRVVGNSWRKGWFRVKHIRGQRSRTHQALIGGELRRNAQRRI